MRLLKRLPNADLELTSFNEDELPPYAVLSHTWGKEREEVTFQDMVQRKGRRKAGYKKIEFCSERAARDGLQFCWVDSCCINKEIPSELHHALSSMFRWYQRSTKCYVYLSDVLEKRWTTWEEAIRQSRWFTRGWTLPELLAPTSVEFFSAEPYRLGDKRSLEQHIHEVTGIPKSALRGAPLSQFNVDERLMWVNRRQTKLPEDKVYSLLGIFDLDMPLSYGEGWTSANNRLKDLINKRERCIQDLRLTDPHDEKRRIEYEKGGLLKDSYRWILKNSNFQSWRNEQQDRLLWVKGDPGKGKTMLLCGIITDLNESIAKTALISFCFCVATDSRINTAVAVLRRLIYMLVCQQPSLVTHIRNRYDSAGKALFEDANAWFALCEILTEIMQDKTLKNAYLIIDALDECISTDLPKLLEFIVSKSSTSTRVKWIISSRNWPNIEKKLKAVKQGIWLCLELNEHSVLAAVNSYIEFKIDQLVKDNEYTETTHEAIRNYLLSNAHGTFLWVALVCQRLVDVPGWDAEKVCKNFPPGLGPLYKRMLDQISCSESALLCKEVLAIMSVVRRPITVDELSVFVDVSAQTYHVYNVLLEIVKLCGSFLTLQESTISFIHQSAKDYLIENAQKEIYTSGVELVHYTIFFRSLQFMSKLKRNIYGLDTPGISIDDIKQFDPDRLAPARYSCVYWISHLLDCNPIRNATNDLEEGGSVDSFIRQRYLYWLEALSLCKSIPEGLVSMRRLDNLLQTRLRSHELHKLLKDAYRFIMSHKQSIQNNPLQVYVSALIFSPTNSLIRRSFEREEPEWVTVKPKVSETWSLCLQTLEGHSSHVCSVRYSHDSTRLVSTSVDHTIKFWDTESGECLHTGEAYGQRAPYAILRDSTRLVSISSDHKIWFWDAESGECLRKLEGHSDFVNYVAFSHDSKLFASTSKDRTVKVWDTESGKCLRTLDSSGYDDHTAAFSHDSERIASASFDLKIKIWDIKSGECLQTHEGFSSDMEPIAFSHDYTQIASTLHDGVIKIWDAKSGECLQTLQDHNGRILSAAFSHDSRRLASISSNYTVKIWDAKRGECLQTVKDHELHLSDTNYDGSVAFLNHSAWLASTSPSCGIKIWDIESGRCIRILEDYYRPVSSIAFSHSSMLIASTSDRRIKIWDALGGECLQTLQGHSRKVSSIAFSHDSVRLVSASNDHTIKIWDIESSECLQTLEGHRKDIYAANFSCDSTRLVSASHDRSVKIWDTNSGACIQTLDYAASLIVFSQDSTRLLSASSDHVIKIRDTKSGELLQMLEKYDNNEHYTKDLNYGSVSMSFSHDSTQLASAGWFQNKLWDTKSGICLHTLYGHRDLVHSFAFSHDSTRLASGSRDCTIKLWDTKSGGCLQTLEGHSSDITAITFSDDSTRLASASQDCTVKIWDINNSEYLQRTTDYGGEVISVIISHDSKRLVSVSGSSNFTVKIWDTDSGDCLHILNDATKPVIFSHNSMQLATASSSKFSESGYEIMRTWDVHSGKWLQTFGDDYRFDGVISLVFSRNSEWLAAASYERIGIWDASSGECLQALETGNGYSLDLLSFSHDSLRLASSSCGQSMIWDVYSGKCLQSFQGREWGIRSMTFLHDSLQLASASIDGKIRVWNLDSGNCARTLTVGESFIHDNLRSMSLDATQLHLDTTRGLVSLGNVLSCSEVDTIEVQDMNFQGLGLSKNGEWITFNGENLVWLPSEHRSKHRLSCSAVSGSKIGLVTGSGRLWMCDLQVNGSSFSERH